MAYLGSWKVDDYVTFCCNTHDPDTGVATDADAVPAYRVYKDETATPILTGTMTLLDSGNTTGFYSERIQLTAASGFEKGKCYTVYIAATVDSDSGTTHHSFQIEAEVDANTISASLNDPTAAAIADAVWDETSTGHVSAGKAGQQIWTDVDAILADTDEVQADLADGGRLDLLIDTICAVTAAVIADAVWDETSTGHVSAGKAGQQIWTDVDAILADTDEVQADLADGGRLDLLIDTICAVTAAVIADAVWDEAASAHDTEDSFGNVVNDLTEESGGTYRFTEAALAQGPPGGAAIAGAVTWIYTLTSSVDGTAVVGAEVWVTSDEGGDNLLASGVTDSDGKVTFYLDEGTVYVWRQKPGWDFDNPDEDTVEE